MPVYEYKCHGCEKEVDISQSIKEKPKKKCPLCNQLLKVSVKILYRRKMLNIKKP